jgi:hypothetical protein
MLVRANKVAIAANELATAIDLDQRRPCASLQTVWLTGVMSSDVLIESVFHNPEAQLGWSQTVRQKKAHYG